MVQMQPVGQTDSEILEIGFSFFSFEQVQNPEKDVVTDIECVRDLLAKYELFEK